jgi:hypothetical protein
VSLCSINSSNLFLDRWLAKDEDDGLIERELPAEKEGQPAIPLLTYKIQVITGNSLPKNH